MPGVANSTMKWPTLRSRLWAISLSPGAAMACAASLFVRADRARAARVCLGSNCGRPAALRQSIPAAEQDDKRRTTAIRYRQLTTRGAGPLISAKLTAAPAKGQVAS